jgi:hypothetical protein
MSRPGDVWPCEPGEVFQNERGEKFVCVGYWTCPVVIMKPADGSNPLIGGIGGYMWNGFTRTGQVDFGLLDERAVSNPDLTEVGKSMARDAGYRVESAA